MTSRPIDRRSFLAGSGLVAGSAFLTGCQHGEDPYALEKPAVPGAKTWVRGQEKSIATACGQCPASCGVRVRVVEGRAVHVAGNTQCLINEGGVGPRGLSAPQVLYDPDRLQGPLKRVGPRGGGKLEPATWDEAITTIAGALAKLRQEGAAQRLGIVCGRERGLVREAWERFARVYGTPNVFTRLSGGSGPIALASELMQGVPEVPAYDWAGARCVLSIGSGLLDSCQQVAFTRARARAAQGKLGLRAKIVHVGPASSRTGQAADRWIMIRPGTHAAFVLGVAHVLVREELHDKAFADEHGFGFETWKDAAGKEHKGFREYLGAYSPAAAAARCGVSVESIERVARELARLRPSFAWAASDELQTSHGLTTAMAVHALNALLGAIDRPGGLLVQRAPPLAPWAEIEPDESALKSLAAERLGTFGGTRHPFGSPPLDALRAALVEKKPYGLEALFLDATNPVYARARGHRWREALAQVPLVVSFTPFLDETASECADWVLPDDTYLERFEDGAPAPSLGRAVFVLRQPVVERLFDTRSTGDVVIQLARALESPLADSFAWKDFKDAVKQRLIGLHNAKRGSIVEEKGSGFLKRLYDVGTWVDEPVAYEQWAETLRTPSTKFEFASQRLFAAIEAAAARAGQPTDRWLSAHGIVADPDVACMPHDAEFALSGTADGKSLVLLPYRSSTHAEGSGANLPWLREVRTHPGLPHGATPVELNASTAERLGIRTGDHVRVESAAGAIEGVAWLTNGLHPEAVRIPEGGGHTAFGRFARGVGANVQSIVSGEAVHPLATFGTVCDTRVRVTRIA